jgi:hypothetical protein
MNKTASLSKEVLELVSTVERLAAEDQERILRIVSLLLMVPSAAQRETQRMLKALVDGNPRSIFDCVHGVDEVIEYLENCMFAKRVTRHDRFYSRPVSRQQN